MTYALHAVIVKKPVTKKKLEEIREHFINSREKSFMRETGQSFRVRNHSKQKFISKTFRTKKISPNVSLVFGKLKPEWVQLEEHANKVIHLKGAGVLDYFKNKFNQVGTTVSSGIKSVKDYFSPKLDDYNNKSKATINKYGNMMISKMHIYRTPLSSKVNSFLNLLSFGKLAGIKKKYGFDDFFHLALVCNVGNKHIMCQKNSVVDITESYKTTELTEVFNIKMKGKQFTLNDMLDKTRNRMGDQAYFEYDMLSHNCQNYVANLLISEDLYTPDVEAFVYQNIAEIIKEIPEYSKKLIRGTTDLDATINKLTGGVQSGAEYVPFNPNNPFHLFRGYGKKFKTKILPVDYTETKIIGDRTHTHKYNYQQIKEETNERKLLDYINEYNNKMLKKHDTKRYNDEMNFLRERAEIAAARLRELELAAARLRESESVHNHNDVKVDDSNLPALNWHEYSNHFLEGQGKKRGGSGKSQRQKDAERERFISDILSDIKEIEVIPKFKRDKDIKQIFDIEKETLINDNYKQYKEIIEEMINAYRHDRSDTNFNRLKDVVVNLRADIENYKSHLEHFMNNQQHSSMFSHDNKESNDFNDMENNFKINSGSEPSSDSGSGRKKIGRGVEEDFNDFIKKQRRILGIGRRKKGGAINNVVPYGRPQDSMKRPDFSEGVVPNKNDLLNRTALPINPPRNPALEVKPYNRIVGSGFHLYTLAQLKQIVKAFELHTKIKTTGLKREQLLAEIEKHLIIKGDKIYIKSDNFDMPKFKLNKKMEKHTESKPESKTKDIKKEIKALIKEIKESGDKYKIDVNKNEKEINKLNEMIKNYDMKMSKKKEEKNALPSKLSEKDEIIYMYNHLKAIKKIEEKKYDDEVVEYETDLSELLVDVLDIISSYYDNKYNEEVYNEKYDKKLLKQYHVDWDLLSKIIKSEKVKDKNIINYVNSKGTIVKSANFLENAPEFKGNLDSAFKHMADANKPVEKKEEKKAVKPLSKTKLAYLKHVAEKAPPKVEEKHNEDDIKLPKLSDDMIEKIKSKIHPKHEMKKEVYAVLQQIKDGKQYIPLTGHNHMIMGIILRIINYEL